MPMYGKQGGTWRLANSPASNQVFGKANGQWYAAKFIYGKMNGQWYNTGYLGRPDSPQLAGGWGSIVTSAADNFSTVTLGYWGPSGGAPPSGYIARMYNSGMGLLAEILPSTPGYQAGYASFNVSQNTSYIFRVYSVNAAGESVGYLEARYAIGHVQQTRQDPVNGWQNEYDWGVDVTAASTQKSDHLSGSAVDWKNDPNGCWGTFWMSEPRPAVWCMDGLRLYPRPGPHPENTRLNGVRFWQAYGGSMFIGLWSDYNPGGWFGSNNTPTDRGVWDNDDAYNTFAHPYATQVYTPQNQEYHYRPVDVGWDIRAGHMIVDLVAWDLHQVGGAFYAGITEVIFRLSNYGVVGYTTVVTVNQQNNYPW